MYKCKDCEYFKNDCGFSDVDEISEFDGKIVRNLYRKSFSHKDVLSLLQSFDELWKYIREDIEEQKDLESLTKYLSKYGDSNTARRSFLNSDGTLEKFHNHAHIEIFSKKKNYDMEMIAKIKTAYKQGIIELALDSDNMIGFKIKNLKHHITKEKINDIFSIDFFRYNLPEINHTELAKSIYSQDELSEMIYESVLTCMDDIKISIFKKLQRT